MERASHPSYPALITDATLPSGWHQAPGSSWEGVKGNGVRSTGPGRAFPRGIRASPRRPEGGNGLVRERHWERPEGVNDEGQDGGQEASQEGKDGRSQEP